MKQTLVYHTDLSFRDVMRVMEANGEGFLAVVDDDHKLLGTISDSDIRRGILNNRTQVMEIMNLEPMTILRGTTLPTAVQEGKSRQSRYIPVVDESGKLLELLAIKGQLLKSRPNKVVIMAGGLGRRLGELTEDLPKPMLPMGHKPILHIILDSFMEYGFRDFYFCVNYKSGVIREYFGDGKSFGANITYVEESQALGTAGALSLIEAPFDAPFFLINGDLITSLNFDSLLNFHLEREATGTMCIHEYSQQLPYGVVNARNGRILSLEEKPFHTYYVNAGIYVLNPEVKSRIPYGQPFDMTTLFEQLVAEDFEVNAYIINEFWVDIGQIRDYEQTRQVFSKFGI
ncbi:MAG: nucleotidyltransferase family protein [Bacteroidia bacterium]|nr:nucleotidyltransferase family protein [Bacteroidia bacterium]